MLIVYINCGPGWEPITHMVHLAAELFEAELLVLEPTPPVSLLAKLELLLLRKKNTTSTETCLLVCPGAPNFTALLSIPQWRKRFRFLAAWVIDSFWLNHIPTVTKLSRPFDHIFITSEEDVKAWRDAMKTPTTSLAWGSDVLRFGSSGSERPWDLARIGRQPDEWDDDANTKKMCESVDLNFHGRLKGYAIEAKNQEMLMELYSQTKYVLAFSNTAHPSHYTHPIRQYITARWTDAIASGAIVAGIVPNEPSINSLLWDGATLDLKSIQIKPGLQIIVEAVKQWKPEQAIKNHQLALERLDWRWRFAQIALVFGESPARLNEDIQLLKQKIAHKNNS